jgi:hypothetical protein
MPSVIVSVVLHGNFSTVLISRISDRRIYENGSVRRSPFFQIKKRQIFLVELVEEIRLAKADRPSI